jgi:phosphatidylserine/phosphatidylglycerophosphate/cardiolipin synthase-like enzyme
MSTRIVWLLTLFSMIWACNTAPSTAELDLTRGGRVEVFFNDPGSRSENIWEPDAVEIMVDIIDGTEATLEIAVMGFNREEVVDAVVRAHDRGVKVRIVGDSDHLYNSGYQTALDRHIPLVTGNAAHIMHDKFLISDRRFLFAGTANWTDTDLRRNSNNFILIDSPPVALDFLDEFEQLFSGRFGYLKTEIDNGRTYTVGDTEVEVWFSPNEDAMGRILEYVDAAKESVRFTIFAFTKDQVGSSFIRKQEQFALWDAADGIDVATTDFRDRRSVAGVIDQSQLHSNGQYHEVFRLLGAGIPLKMDGNDNSRHPGDYQAGGGRLHSKTMVIDAEGQDPVVITGSFNWSASATVSNDEFLLILKGPRVAKAYDDYFNLLWADGRRMGNTHVSEGDVAEGDIIINEVMWYGVNSGDSDGFDEFIELKNQTDEDISLDLWQIANADDFVVGLPPGSTIPANGLFTIVDHVLEPYTDGVPQDEGSAFLTGDLIVNSFNDNRQARLYLKDGILDLRLKDPDGVVIDIAGDGGAAFAGGPSGSKAYSMERNDNPGDGSLSESWHTCTLSTGGSNVNPDYRGEVIASPGQSNSSN